MKNKILIGIFVLVLLISIPTAQAGWFQDTIDWFKDLFGFTEEEAIVYVNQLKDMGNEEIFRNETAVYTRHSETLIVNNIVKTTMSENMFIKNPEKEKPPIKTVNYEGSLKDIPNFYIEKISDDGIKDIEISDYGIDNGKKWIEGIPYVKDSKEFGAITIKTDDKYLKEVDVDSTIPNELLKEKFYFTNNLTIGEHSTTVGITSNMSNQFNDTTVNGEAVQRDTNYGTATQIIVGKNAGWEGPVRGLFYANFSHFIPSNAELVNLTLQLTNTDSGNSGDDLYFLEIMNGSWNENTVTWNTCGGGDGCTNVTGGQQLANSPASPGVNNNSFGFFSDNLTIIENYWLVNASSNYGVIVRVFDDLDTDTSTIYINTREQGGWEAPLWIVEYTVAEPPSDPTGLLNSTLAAQTNYTNENLSYNFLCDDPNADAMTYALEVWKNEVNQTTEYHGGSCVDDEYVAYILISSNTSVGDNISGNIILTDAGGLSSSRVQFNDVIINSQPPNSATELKINATTNNNYTDDNVYAEFRVGSSPNEEDVVYNISWYKNGAEQFTFGNLTNTTELTLKTLTNENTSSGDLWEAGVIICDIPNYACSSWVFTGNITIVNRAPTTPTINTPPNNTQTGNTSILLNCSGSTDPDLDTIYYEIYADTSNPPTTQVNISEEGIYNHTTGGDFWFRCRANDTIGYSAYTDSIYFQMDSRRIFNLSESFDNDVVEGSSHYYESNITFNKWNTNDINVVLNYNGTNYSLTKNVLSNQPDIKEIQFYTNIITPVVNGGDIKGIWDIALSMIDGTTERNNTYTFTQTTRASGIDDCSSYGNQSVILSVFNEQDVLERYNATWEVEAEFWVTDPSINNSFYGSSDNTHEYSLCISETNLTIYGNVYFRYTVEGGFTHRYYLINETMTDALDNISVYNFNTTTDISNLKLTLRDKATYSIFGNIYAKLQRRYSSEGVWRSVQMDRSGDFGLAFFNIEEEDTDYRLIFLDGVPNTLKTTESMKFVCDSSLCELTIVLDPFATAAISPELSWFVDHNNATGIINVTWNDPLDRTSSVRLLVTKETMGGTTEICDTTQSGSAGTINCDASAYTGDVFVRLYSSASPEEPLYSEWRKLTTVVIGNLISAGEGAFWTFGIMVTVVGFGITVSPVAAVIMTIIGLIMISFLGLFTPITLTFIIIATVIGIAIGVKVRS